ncbi:MAG: prenyltransferase [Acidimicrobiia bacterium]
MTQVVAIVRLARPHFLLGGLLLFALGAFSTGSLDAGGYAIGQAMVTATQLTAHLVNESADARADALVRNRTWFSGGSGAIADGSVSPRTALVAALFTSAVAVGFIGLMYARNPQAASIGVAALLVAWLYSVEPIRLLATGIGEIVTTLVVAMGVPIVGALANGGSVAEPLRWAIVALLPIHLAMMLCFELPDLDTDREASKRVAAVRLGRQRTEALVGVLFGLGGGVLAVGIVTGHLPDLALAAFAAATPAAVAMWAMRRARWGALTLGAVATLVVAALGLLVALA